MTERRSHMRGVVIVAGVIIAINLVLFVVGRVLPSPSGPPSSSYATSQRGFAAWAELLERYGHRVVRERRLPGKSQLSPGATAVVLDADTVTEDDGAALKGFVESGGRLVAGGRRPGWLRYVLGHGPALGRGGGRVELHQGNGDVVLVPSSRPVENRNLAHGDSALFALQLAGPPEREVVFFESFHGYGSVRGFGALPKNWKLALLGLLLAALVWMASHARRLGPAEPRGRPAPPPRRLYVDAVAATLARTKAPGEAAEPLRRHALDALAARTGKAGSFDDAARQRGEIERAAAKAGLGPEEARALVAAARTDSDLMALGAVAAKLQKRGS